MEGWKVEGCFRKRSTKKKGKGGGWWEVEAIYARGGLARISGPGWMVGWGRPGASGASTRPTSCESREFKYEELSEL